MYTYMPLSVKVKSDLYAGLHVDHVDIILTCIWLTIIYLERPLFLDECCMNVGLPASFNLLLYRMDGIYL